ncbi:MAG: CoA transferase, partial [Hyphomicrobiaceae bacterium]
AGIADLPDDAQAVAAGYIVETDIEEMPRTIASPFQLSGIAPRRAGNGPAVGAHTDDILGEAGFTADDIARLRADGAIG